MSYTTSELQRQKHRAKANSAAKTSLSTLLLVFFALYFLLPIYWLLVSTTKTTNELFSLPMLLFGSLKSFTAGFQWLNSYNNGVFWIWFLNSILYAGVTAALGSLISSLSGYALSKYRFKSSKLVLSLTLGAMMIPQAATVIPIFLMIKSLGLMNSYIGVILPMLASPFGVYFMSVYIKDAMPSELIDSGRIDGASDYAIFMRIALPVLLPGFITLFLIMFISTWNNFFLPLVLLSQTNRYPLTVGLSIWISNLNTAGTGKPLYPLIMIGSFMSILPMLISFPFLRKFITSGISMGSVKG